MSSKVENMRGEGRRGEGGGERYLGHREENSPPISAH